MTPQIALSLGILALAALLFISERIRVDLVALLVLVVLALTGLVTPAEALSGFSNPAVITVWAVFVLSSGLARTGIANRLGRQLLRLAGESEVRLLLVIMLAAGLMSAFMNNVGVAAMLLPVVVNVARQSGRSPSKLLIPLAFASLLGGLTTLIGTPPNILASTALVEGGFQAFDFFDFAPVGLTVLAVGVLYLLLLGRRMLPSRDAAREFRPAGEISPGKVFSLEERLFFLTLPADSALAGRTLQGSRLGTALRLNVISIIRNGQSHLAPEPTEILRPRDRLLVSGRPDRLIELGRGLLLEEESQLDDGLRVEHLISSQIQLLELTPLAEAEFFGLTLAEMEFRSKFGCIVLAIMDDGIPRRSDVQDVRLQPGDTLLVQATGEQRARLEESGQFSVQACRSTEAYRLHERLHLFRVPAGSGLDGKTLTESHLGAAYGLGVMGIFRNGDKYLMPDPQEKLRAGDTLLVKGRRESIEILRGLQALEIDQMSAPKLSEIESEAVGLVEVVLSPHTAISGKTLHQLAFREKYGLTVLALWRGGRAYRFNLRDMPLRFGDSLLVHGKRAKLKVLGAEPDFIVLEESAQVPPRIQKAPLAAAIMGAVVLSVALGFLPISIAAVAGATLMVLTGCLNMEEAYRSIEWQAVFLIAGMLPLGIAMQNSGAAGFLAQGVIGLAGGYGAVALMAGLFLLTALVSQVIPTAVVIVLIAPVAITTAVNLGYSPYALMMLVAVAASTTFLSPISHPANILIMGPGGYRFADYFKVGLPLTLLVMLVTLLVLPVFWPL